MSPVSFLARTRPSAAPGENGRLDVAREVALRAVAEAPVLTVFRSLDSSPKGLFEAEADERSRAGGDNRIAPASTSDGSWARLRAAASSPFVALLAGLGIVFAVVGDLRGGVTVSVMVTLSVALRWWQQRRSDRAMRALRALVTTTVTVRRRAEHDGSVQEREIPVEDLVPGDVIVLGPGDVVPADVRLVAARDLLVDQSSLSGEALPVRKRVPAGQPPARRRQPAPGEIVELAGLCFAGTSVVGGSATAVVLATGAQTYFSSVARGSRGPRPESSVDAGVRAVGWTLVRFMLVLVPIVLVVNGTVTGNWGEAALYAVAIAVGLTPEMLPVIVTTTLARGAMRLARRKVIVTRLDAIQDLGGMDVLCVDKTGTLTEDRVAFVHSIDALGELDSEAAAYAFVATHFQSVPRNRLDESIVDYVAEDEVLLADAMYEKVDEIAFDDRRRRGTVVVRRADEHLVVSKGDPDGILPLCTHARRANAVVELTDDLRAQAADVVEACTRTACGSSRSRPRRPRRGWANTARPTRTVWSWSGSSGSSTRCARPPPTRPSTWPGTGCG